MKFTVRFKDPDGVYVSLRDAAYESVRKIEGIPHDDSFELAEDRQDWLYEFIKRWIANGEDITIDFDTDLETATVRKIK